MQHILQSLFDLSYTNTIRDDEYSKVVRHPKAEGGCYYQKDILYKSINSMESDDNYLSSLYWSERENMFIITTKNSNHIVRAAIYDNYNKKKSSVITEDAGLSVENWLTVIPKNNSVNVSISHPFQYVTEFAKLARYCLLALYDIHQNDIVHLDIKADNICLSYKPYPFKENSVLEIDYENIKIIDFTYSIHKFNILKYPLPIKKHSTFNYQSNKLFLALEMQKNGFDAYQNNPCQNLDYSVDLYSLGYMLNDIYMQGLIYPNNTAFENDVADDIKKLIDYLLSFNNGIPDESKLDFSHHLKALEMLDIITQYFSKDYEIPFRFKINYKQEIDIKNFLQKTEYENTKNKNPSDFYNSEVEKMNDTVAKSDKAAYKKRNMIMTCAFFLILTLAIFFNADSIRNIINPITVDDLYKTDLNTSVWQRFQQLLQRNNEDANNVARDLSVRLEANLHNEELDEAIRITAYKQLNKLAVWNIKAAQEVLKIFHENYALEREPIITSSWWKDGKGVEPIAIDQFIAMNHILVANQDRLAILDAADMYRTGSGESQDLVKAKKLYEHVLATGEPKDSYSIAAKEGLFYVGIQQLH